MQGTMERKEWQEPEITRAECVEQIRVNLLQLMERDRIITPGLAAEATGYPVRKIYAFLTKEQPNLLLAQRLVMEYPEVGELSFVCQHCGRLPHF